MPVHLRSCDTSSNGYDMIKMLKRRGWRGAQLSKGEEYNLPRVAEKMLVSEGVAEYVGESVETAALTQPRRGRQVKRKVSRGNS